jgi:hypothetical protein
METSRDAASSGAAIVRRLNASLERAKLHPNFDAAKRGRRLGVDAVPVA